MKKVVLNIFIIIYFIITVLVTVSLLSYNDFNVSTINNHSLVTKKNGSDLKISNSDLLIIDNTIDVKEGDDIYYYDTYASPIDIKIEKVKEVENINENEKTITMDNGSIISSEYVIGKENASKEYAVVGAIYNVLTSRWGYLFIIILPMLMAFVYEIYEIIREIKRG